WIKKFSNVLKEKFSFLNFKFPKYKFISSIDIDNAFAFKHKGIMRSLGGYVRGLINLNWKNISERTKVILNKVPDPFDSYAFQLELQKKYDFTVIYFFLLGDYGVNDKNLPANNKQLRYLIKHLSDYFEIGIHPSFGSKNNSIQVKKEINRLYRITHKDVFSSRQHFSILSFPSTYQMLLDNEIKQDFSMGYHDRAGFRAGISTSYFWYDLENELETALKIYPLVFSETTFRFGMRLNPEESLQKAIQLIDRIKVTNGTFVTCFHNESMTDYGEWKGWRNFYEQIIQESIK
ncbi:MAG: polysaccharide deacetylase family protein, partial [Bacteroidota bacterium]